MVLEKHRDCITLNIAFLLLTTIESNVKLVKRSHAKILKRFMSDSVGKNYITKQSPPPRLSVCLFPINAKAATWIFMRFSLID